MAWYLYYIYIYFRKLLITIIIRIIRIANNEGLKGI